MPIKMPKKALKMLVELLDFDWSAEYVTDSLLFDWFELINNQQTNKRISEKNLFDKP